MASLEGWNLSPLTTLYRFGDVRQYLREELTVSAVLVCSRRSAN